MTHTLESRRRWLQAVTGIAALGLAGCAAWQPAPRTVGISQAKLLEIIAGQLLQDFVVHRLKSEDPQASRGWGYQPGALQVVPGGLQLQLNPVQR